MFSLKRGLYNVCRAILAGRNAILLYYCPLNFFRHIKKVGLNQGGSFLIFSFFYNIGRFV